jgi:hypothetical protein
VANFWRALAADPEQVARYADWPVNEIDLTARHIWLVQQRSTLTTRLEGDPDFYDPKIAGWWVWGLCCWIGSGWCSGDGPWTSEDGKLVRLGNAGRGVHRQLAHLGNAGQGVHRNLVHLGPGRGVHRKRVHLGDAGQGVHRKRVPLGSAGQGVHRKRFHLGSAGRGESGLVAWFGELADRLKRVRVCCGDWTRVLGEAPTARLALTGVFLDPPYSAEAERDMGLYTHDDGAVGPAVRAWAIANGDNPLLRIALCSYGEAPVPDGWARVGWKAKGGYAAQGGGRNLNAGRETIDFSPHCLRVDRLRQVSFLDPAS